MGKRKSKAKESLADRNDERAEGGGAAGKKKARKSSPVVRTPQTSPSHAERVLRSAESSKRKAPMNISISTNRRTALPGEPQGPQTRKSTEKATPTTPPRTPQQKRAPTARNAGTDAHTRRGPRDAPSASKSPNGQVKTPLETKQYWAAVDATPLAEEEEEGQD